MPRARLSRRAVTDAALDLVDGGGTGGFDGLSLAAVAARTGVAVPSLYKHVGSLADLRRSVAVASVAELTTVIEAASIGRAGPDALRASMAAVREFAGRHPGRYAATQVAGRPGDPDDTELTEAGAATVTALARVLRGFGLAPERTVDAVRLLRSALHGFVVLELGGGFGLPDDLDRSFALVVDTVIAGIERLAAAPEAHA
ncbi:TetR/AcrR family transcriptional regulator [Glaciibacter sp. 2TAF33]|uniref:TetR/AcrR family transcriptional regulator n=1 Tax=Glaciibacter sp. 2TAF33 TaxID=3233015 RepID=UPI003F8E1FF2